MNQFLKYLEILKRVLFCNEQLIEILLEIIKSQCSDYIICHIMSTVISRYFICF